MKHKKQPTFHLECDCIYQLQQQVRSQGQDLLGLSAFSDKQGNTGIAVATASRIVGLKGGRKTGVVYLNFCPICGSRIRKTHIEGVDDEESSSIKSGP